MVDQLRVVVTSLNGFTERIVKVLTLEVTSELKRTTPVDTGWAANNWVPRIGAAYTGTAGSYEQALAGNVDTATSALGIAQVATSYRLQQGRVFISNNVPYISLLNSGSSRQAPAAFVQAAIGRAVLVTVQKARRLGR